jgi:hypothetical protein
VDIQDHVALVDLDGGVWMGSCIVEEVGGCVHDLGGDSWVWAEARVPKATSMVLSTALA